MLFALELAGVPYAAHAAGTVGTGTAASCTEAALDAALAGGGTVTFSCGAAPVTITLTTQKNVGITTAIDGTGLVTLDANNTLRHFATSASAGLDLKNIRLINGNGQTPYLGNSYAGAVYAAGSTALTMTDVVLSNNTASYGGAVFVDANATLVLKRVSMISNRASNEGGGIEYFGKALDVAESLFASNSTAAIGAAGGAINVHPVTTTTLNVVNSTFYDNGGGNQSTGGALELTKVSNGAINNSTFANNRAQGAIQVADGISVVAMRNSIISATVNQANCTFFGGGVLFDGGHNLQFGGTVPNSCGAGFQIADPKLGLLANNGGATSTMALLAGSPAIDAGNNVSCTTIDQRGVARPIGAACDIGAFEAPLANVAPTITNGPPPSGIVGTAYSFAYIAAGSTPISFSLAAGTLPPGLSLSAGTISGTPTAAGTYSGSVAASNGTLPNASQAFSITIAPAAIATSTVPAPGLNMWGMLLLIGAVLCASVVSAKLSATRFEG